eukprot:6214206-Pleurochrysis_carterae.AAC.1
MIDNARIYALNEPASAQPGETRLHARCLAVSARAAHSWECARGTTKWRAYGAARRACAVRLKVRTQKNDTLGLRALQAAHPASGSTFGARDRAVHGMWRRAARCASNEHAAAREK